MTGARNAGADPEFSGKNAVMIDQVAAGYRVCFAQTSLPQVGVYGFKPSMVQLLEQSGRFEVHELQGHVAVRARPKNNLETIRHVVESELSVAVTHPSIGLRERDFFHAGIS
jgi:hypothetical protein